MEQGRVKAVLSLLLLTAIFGVLSSGGCRGVGENYSELRRRMVEEQIAARGITDSLVLSSMLAVPRHLFVPKGMRHLAYIDSPLPIGEGQTISQPFIVALMTSMLE